MRIGYQVLVRFIYRRHATIIAVALALAVVSGFFALRLADNIKTDFADLLPDDYVSVRELRRIKARAGGIGPLMVVITGDDLDRCIAFMEVLADSVEQNPLVTAVTRYSYRDFLDGNRLLYMDQDDVELIRQRLESHIEQRKLERSPLYFALDDEEPAELDLSDIEARYKRLQHGEELNGDAPAAARKYYLTQERNGVILRLYPSGVITDVRFSQQLLQSLDRTIAQLDPRSFDPSIEWAYRGAFTNSAGQMRIIVDDLMSTAALSVIGVLLLISLHFRQLLGAVLVAVPLVMGLSCAFGLTYAVIGSLNMITVGLFAILFGLGIDFGIHTLSRYSEARRRGLPVEGALAETVVQTGSAQTTSAVTTSLAFYSLLITDFRGFSEVGFIVGTGILFSLAAMLIVCPAFIVLAERWRLLRWRESAVPQHLVRKGAYPWPWATLAIGAGMVAYSLWHARDIEFEYDFSKLKPPIEAEESSRGSLPESMKEDRSPAIVLT